VRRWQSLAQIIQNNPVLRLYTGAEVGVRTGQTSSHLLRVFPDLHLHTVDPWVPQPTGNETYDDWDFNAMKHEFQSNVRDFKSRITHHEMFSVEAANEVSDNSLDFVFIDAQHDYYSVKADILAWMYKVRPGGLLCGHDYDQVKFPGVVKAVKGFFKTRGASYTLWPCFIWGGPRTW